MVLKKTTETQRQQRKMIADFIVVSFVSCVSCVSCAYPSVRLRTTLHHPKVRTQKQAAHPEGQAANSIQAFNSLEHEGCLAYQLTVNLTVVRLCLD